MGGYATCPHNTYTKTGIVVNIVDDKLRNTDRCFSHFRSAASISFANLIERWSGETKWSLEAISGCAIRALYCHSFSQRLTVSCNKKQRVDRYRPLANGDDVTNSTAVCACWARLLSSRRPNGFMSYAKNQKPKKALLAHWIASHLCCCHRNSVALAERQARKQKYLKKMRRTKKKIQATNGVTNDRRDNKADTTVCVW